MTIDRQAVGRAAEDRAAEFLCARGLEILFRNFRCRFGELDIVARTGDGIVVIAEVRHRAPNRHGDAAATVDVHKQHRVTLATRLLLARHPRLARHPLRFDVLAIDGDGDIRWIPQAFDAR
jgi:putative endonuclease